MKTALRCQAKLNITRPNGTTSTRIEMLLELGGALHTKMVAHLHKQALEPFTQYVSLCSVTIRGSTKTTNRPFWQLLCTEGVCVVCSRSVHNAFDSEFQTFQFNQKSTCVTLPWNVRCWGFCYDWRRFNVSQLAQGLTSHRQTHPCWSSACWPYSLVWHVRWQSTADLSGQGTDTQTDGGRTEILARRWKFRQFYSHRKKTQPESDFPKKTETTRLISVGVTVHLSSVRSLETLPKWLVYRNTTSSFGLNRLKSRFKVQYGLNKGEKDNCIVFFKNFLSNCA